MSLESENKMAEQAESSLEKLKAAAKTQLYTATQKPYQPIVYAIPQEQWDAFLEWTKEAVFFQPTLYKMLKDLMTREEFASEKAATWKALEDWSDRVSTKLTKTMSDVVPKTEKILNDHREVLLQDGKKRDEYFSKIERTEQTRLGEYEKLLAKTKRWLITAVITSTAASAIFTMVISLLMR